MAPTMKQWTTNMDGLDKVQFGEAERPSPKDGEVLVKILAVALNYRDTEGNTARRACGRFIC
jgi:NADPH:quinone reductase-like Zn-dependent oxidoreductase